MIDYHVHSILSGDAQGSAADICREAIKKGITEICFTEHVDFEPTDLCFGAFDYLRHIENINRAQEMFGSKITIRRGIEVDYQEKHRPQIEDFVESKEFDYIVGSAHYANGVILEDHRRYFPGKTAEEAYIPYFQTALATVQSNLFDTFAHLDLCKRYGVRYFGEFDWEVFRDCIDPVLKAIIERKITLEINTSGLRQSPNDTYPGEGILSRYYKLGGRNITVGSDAHKVEDVGAGIEQALEIASRIGFQNIDTYCGRKRSWVPISSILCRR